MMIRLRMFTIDAIFGALSLIGLIGQTYATHSIVPGLKHLELLNEKLTSPFGPKDASPDTMDIIIARGFVAELYSVPARDGAPMSIYHIINPLADQQTLNRYPVLVFHGITGDSSQLISHSEKQEARAPIAGQVTANENDTSLPFLLSNNNFDVYLIDARGTNLNNHLISTEFDLIGSSNYWNFSLDEQIHCDLPAAIDFVLEQSHEKKLHFIGFSESTLFMFALLASQPDYHNKLVSFVALAPVCYVSNGRGTTWSLFPFSALIPDSINGNYVPQLVADTFIAAIRQVCQFQLIRNIACKFFASAISGFSASKSSQGFFSTALKSTSIKAVKHFLQLYVAQRFGMYDYGSEGNLRMYGNKTAPDYQLSKVRLPSIILFRGDEDFLSTSKDQERLLRELGTQPLLDFRFPRYNHIDFILGENVVRDINFPATQEMFKLNKQHANREPVRPSSNLRDPKKFLLPWPHKPISVRAPDGNRELQVKSHFVSNLVEGLLGPSMSRVVDLGERLKRLFNDHFLQSQNLSQALVLP